MSNIAYVVISKFVIANDMLEEVKQAFLQRPHLVDNEPGFLGMEVLSNIEHPEEIFLVTRWSDLENYRKWHKSHSYQQSHIGIPKGLKLVPEETRIKEFEVVCQ